VPASRQLRGGVYQYKGMIERRRKYKVVPVSLMERLSPGYVYVQSR
jgi:hypothetical protein